MKLSKAEGVYLLQIDMTPFIDIVFNLVIFFILVVDMSQQDLVVLKLPSVDMGNPDKDPEKDRLIVNITKEGKYMIKIREYDLPALKIFLASRADRKRDAQKLSEIPLLIRCDRAAEFRFVQMIMQACADPAVQIWKIHLAVSSPPGAQKRDIFGGPAGQGG